MTTSCLGALRRSAVLVVLPLATACVAINQRPPQHFLEPFDVARVPADSSLMYEADVAPHLFLHDGLPDAYDRLSGNDRRVGETPAWRVILSPMFVIRQLRDSSAAVRTPSFMPRVSVEYVSASRLGTPTLDPDIQFAGVRLLGARLSLAHHSNGQAGCFRNGFVPVDVHSDVCTWDRKTDTSVVMLNRANGDFSSTYVEGLVYAKWMNRGASQLSTLGGGVAVAADLYPHGIFGALSSEQAALYGQWRWRVISEGDWRPQAGIACGDPGHRSAGCALAGRVAMRGEYVRAPTMTTPLALRLAQPIIPYRWSGELSYSMDVLLGSGPFVRWQDGQDYYNIGFVNRRRGWMFGVTLVPGGPDRITRKSPLP